MFRPLFKSLLISLIFLGATDARTLEELEVAYEVKILALEKDHRESLQKLNQGYLGALKAVQEKLQKSGRLDDVLEVVGEKKALEAGKWPLSKLAESAPRDLLRVRKLYETARIRADRDHAGAMIETSDKMEELLTAQIESLTRAGKITAAKKAKDRLEALKKSPKLTAAREFVKRVRLNQVSPLAMRIRRSGDNLEVLVRFDRSGEVSLDSPVENVVELTGGREEKGETTATVLGEFVGAKGYKVDSYVAFESDMDKITPPMRAGEFRLDPNIEFEKRQTLRILMPDKLTNPRVEWPGVLAPLASSSRVNLEFQYFIPDTNEKLKAFTFHWGFGAVFEKKIMDTQGRWVDELLESESLTAMDTLRFYPSGVKSINKFYNGGNEAIYFDSLKVTYLSFAAHLVEAYKDGKATGEPVVDPLAQEGVALSGKLLPSSKN